MDTTFMNSGNSKTSDPPQTLTHSLGSIKLKNKWQICCFINFSIYYTCKNIKKLFKNNKFKISTPTWNEEFELPERSYSVSDIQD